MPRLILLPLLTLLLCLTASFRAGSSILAGPYLQDATSTSIWICWETASGNESRVDYGSSISLGQTTSGLAFSSSAGTVMHQVQLTGLTPDTTYLYEATTGSSSSGVFHFRTPPALSAETPWRFAAVSDTQIDGGNPLKHREIIEDGILDYVQQQHGPDIPAELAFLLHAGDLVGTGSNHSHWTSHFFGQAASLLREIPLYPVLGNHEQNADLYFEYMRLPDSGTPGFEEHWYYTDYQNVRVVAMDMNSPFTVQSQLDWLDSVLADAASIDRIDFVFAQFHHPAKSELWTPGESGFSSQAVSRLEQFSTASGKPSIHFFGHTHGYSRGQSRDHDHLWVNVATGGGNPDYWYEYSQADYPEFQYSSPEWGFAIVDVQAGADPSFRLRRLSRGNEYVARDNDLIDEITIRRYNLAPDQPSALSPNPGSGIVQGTSVQLVASPFSDPDGDTLLESHWQVSTVSGDWSNPVADEWRRIENWYRPANGDGWYSVDTVTDPLIDDIVLAEPLPGCIQVYWRVRFRDSSLGWSPWSDEQTFQVGDSAGGATEPVPADGATAVTRAPELRWFPCDPQDSFEVYLGDSPTLGAGDHMSSQSGTTFAPGLLDAESTYYWRVDHVLGGQVTPGATWSFTTAPDFPTPHTTEWRFDDANPATGQPLAPAFGGSDLIPLGMSYGSDWLLGSTGAGVPHIGGVPTGYIRLDNVSGAHTGLQTWFNAPGNGGGGSNGLFHFTFVWDLFLDSSQSDLQALWQGNASNTNDAELFLNSSSGGFWVGGGTGYVGSGLWSTGQWVRIAHRVDFASDTSALFVDGVKVLSDDQLGAPDWFYAQGSGLPGWMLTDDNGGSDVALVHCANLAVVDALLPDESIAALGGPDAGGIFVDEGGSYCLASPNSVGAGCLMGRTGSTSIAANDCVLHATDGVPAQFGVFFYGSSQALVPFGDGFRCVSGSIFRLQPPQLTNALGNASRLVDFGAPPAGSGPGQVTAGSTWNFQYWFRDPAAGGTGFNLSDGLALQFAP